MLIFPKAILLLAAGMALLGFTGYTRAESKSDQDRARQLRQSRDILPLQHILKQAKSHHAGYLIEAELSQEEKRWIYEVEFLDESGVVWDMDYDAATGRLLEIEQGK